MNKRLRVGILTMLIAAVSTVALAQSFTTFVNARVTTQLDLQGTLTANGSTGTAGQFLTSNGASDVTWTTPAPGVTGATPTALVGLTAIPGSNDNNFTRSDGAPALSQAIIPTWTGTHTFANSAVGLWVRSTAPGFRIEDVDAPVNEKQWLFDVNGGDYRITTRDDAGGFGALALQINRTANVIDSIQLFSSALTWNNNGVCVSTGANCPGGITGFANPSATIGLTAVNGSATTAMPSDAAPALSQAIAPTWTNRHIFAGVGSFNNSAIEIASALPILEWDATGSTANNRRWRCYPDGEVFSCDAVDDAGNVANDWLTIERTGAVIDQVALTGQAVVLQTNGTPRLSIDSAGQTSMTGAVRATSLAGTAANPNFQISSASPNFGMFETDAASDNGLWIQRPVAEQLRHSACDTSGATCTDYVRVDRTGTTVDNIRIDPTLTVGADKRATEIFRVFGNGQGLEFSSPGGNVFDITQHDGTFYNILQLTANDLQFSDSGGTAVNMTPVKGSFTVDFTAQCSASTTRTVQYYKIGASVTLHMPVVNCTSTTSSFAAAGTPVPSAIRPTAANVETALFAVTDGTSNTHHGSITVTSAGAFIINRCGTVAGTLGTCANSWNASGTKSIQGGDKTITYLRY